MRRSSQVVCIIFLSAVSSASAQTAVEKAKLARIMWSAFQCGTYAEMSGNSKEQSRLFDLAVKSGREFLDAVMNKQIPSEIVAQEAPIGVTMLLQGPSADFIVGRIFENAMRDAYDDIVKKQNGLILDASQWVRDDGLRKSKAQAKYLQGNCALLK